MSATIPKQEIRGLWDSIWPSPVQRVVTQEGPELKLSIGDQQFVVSLLAGAAPVTVETLLAALPLEGYFVHAAWSGEVIRGVGPVDLPGKPGLENATICCAPGDVVYSPEHRELSIIYGDNDMRMVNGPVSSSVFGRIETRVPDLQALGREIRLFGVVPFEFSHDSVAGG